MRAFFYRILNFYLNSSLRIKFICIFFCTAVLPFVIMGLISIRQAGTSLSSQVFKQLQSVQGIKQVQLEEYFSGLFNDLEGFSKSEFLNQAMFSFVRAYIYDKEKVGGESWAEADIDHGLWLEDQLVAVGLDNLFLVDTKGNVLYTGKADRSLLGINIGSGEFADSALAKAYRQGQNELYFQDLTILSRSRKTPVALVSAPIPDYMAGGTQGVMIAQLSWQRINSIVNERTGMGSTGETLLVGPDQLMRSNSFVDPERHSIATSFADPDNGAIHSAMAEAALAGKSGLRLDVSHQGTEVFSVYSPLQVRQTHWALLVELSKKEALSSVSRLKMMLGGVAMGGLVFIVGIAFLFTRALTKPLHQAVETIQELEAGHLDCRLNLQHKDEIGALACAMDSFADSLQNEIVANLERLAAGNLDFSVVPRSGADKFRGSLQKLCIDLNSIIGRIQLAGERIAQSSSQVSHTSQSLSQGATEQASSLEEISASLNQLADRTTTNADNADQASRLVTDAQQAAELGSERMRGMVAAMQEINEASENISKIIKAIDEIAFQTNLLALNAAVEAARAGQHGKGFAVVAEEVRNLAARSSRAAEETAALIQSAVEKTDNGSRIARETADALKVIVAGIGRVSDLVNDIAVASNEQAQGISQINQGVGQVDTVTQQNTANAEESAVAAQELFGQAEQMRRMLHQFVLKDGDHPEQLSSGREKGNDVVDPLEVM